MTTKKLIQVGDLASVNGETRKVTELKKNTEGGLVVAWSTDHLVKKIGCCTPSLWYEWITGINLQMRR